MSQRAPAAPPGGERLDRERLEVRLDLRAGRHSLRQVVQEEGLFRAVHAARHAEAAPLAAAHGVAAPVHRVAEVLHELREHQPRLRDLLDRDLGHVQHPLGDVEEGIEGTAGDAHRPEKLAVLIQLLEGERRRAQRDHLVKARPAAQRFGVGELQVVTRGPLEILEDVFRV